MGFGMSLKIAPGVRIRASGSGIRASVGPRAARIHAGSGRTTVSTGFGPFTASSTASGRRSTAKKTAVPQRRAAPASSKVDTFVAGVELAAGVAEMIGYAADRRHAKRLAADSTKAAEMLTSLHLESFQGPVEPVPPEQPQLSRQWQNLWRMTESERSKAHTAHAEAEALHAEAVARWQLLHAHDPLEVIATVDEALADNASRTACIDAGSGPLGNYVTVVCHYPGLEIAEGVEQAGSSTRPRSDRDKVDLYRRALASTVIASANEALAYAPAATEAYVVVLRYDLRGRRNKKVFELDAIYAGALGREVLDTVAWASTTPLNVILGAREVRVNQDRKAMLQPLGDRAGDDLRSLVTAVAATAHHPRPRRCTCEESQRFMRTQLPEPFIATCGCPGCGTVDAHKMREPRTGEPEWADTIRVCAVCEREWAQS